MTIRNAYENMLIELNKVQAPSILLDDFIYLFNKAVLQYINKRYNLFETKQLLTDDLRVLLKSTEIKYTTTKSDPDPKIIDEEEGVFGKSYKCTLPTDYMHILNCVCKFKLKNGTICNQDVFFSGANKLTTDQWPHVINNYYMKPSVKRPYYYIINVSDPLKTGISDDDKKLKVDSGSEKRYGNTTEPVMQIKCGSDSNYVLESISIDYLRAPQYLSFNESILDNIADTSQVIEFPDYVVYEIINTLVALIMENNSNPRLQTNIPINLSIPQQ